MSVIEYLKSSIVFWMAWVIIPLIMEIIPAIFNFLLLVKKRILMNEKEVKEEFEPEITLIIPVYNSEDTLKECIRSIHDSSYDSSKIYIMLVNNQGNDRSFEIFQECQKEFEDLLITWMNAKQGKSKALNLALFNSLGKYIIHIDSDGVLHKDAIRNIVNKFEQNKKVDCITGVVLTNPEMIEKQMDSFCAYFVKWNFLNIVRRF